ncbi:non-ribosomal peptide synthetase, partial [Virgisporangium aurantiacum]|uniref:non-ribosomal peptide synthetase n=1 Tax=Virgisporangium aurantiacum TaxID=175570 RepID=UPI001951E440
MSDAARPTGRPAAATGQNSPASQPDTSFLDGQALSFPVSFAQQRLWFLQDLDPDNTAYNVVASLRLRGDLDAIALNKALDALVSRHETLRTSFRTIDGELSQVVGPAHPVTIDTVTVGGGTTAEQLDKARQAIAAAARQPFRLSEGQPFRATLIQMSSRDHVLAIVVHHIVFDEWSGGVLTRELEVLYAAFATGTPASLPELPVQYADYASWQREWLQGDVLESQLAYWRAQLVDPPVLELPTDRPRSEHRSAAGDTVSVELSETTSAALRDLCRRAGVTPFIALLAAFQVVLSRLSGQTDVVVGTPVAGRTQADLEPLIGFFVNTLALRSDLSRNPTFLELLLRVRATALAAFAHQDVPFERVVDELRPQREPHRHPLFQVMFTFHNAPGELPACGANWDDMPTWSRRSAELSISPFPAPRTTSLVDLRLAMTEENGTFGGEVEYSTELFDRASVEGLVDGLLAILDAAVADADVPFGLLPIAPDAAVERAMAWGEAPLARVVEGSEVGLVGLLSDWIAAAPGRVAVVDGSGAELTFGEVGDRVAVLAGCLRGLGVGPEARVAVLAGRSVDVVVAMLAVWWAGGVCVPLDEEFPDQRLGWIAGDAEVQVAVTTGEHAGRATGWGVPMVVVDDPQQWPRSEDARRPVSVDRAGLAYVIYTSGSTGAPRPVGVPWECVDWLLRVAGEMLPAELIWACSHSLAFDFSVWELWAALATGGRVVLLPRTVVRSPDQLLAVLAEQHVQVWCQTPSAFGMLDAAEALPQLLPDLRWVIFGGEALDPGSLPDWVGADGAPAVVNMYGITETTVHVTHTTITTAPGGGTGRGGSPIGRPLPGVRIRLLDECLQPVPAGVVGDLYVGGGGVARGYLDRPDATAHRFIPDPHAGDGSRLYRSGDRGYWHDGQLYYVGRADTQIKIRGYRIEPAEIETALTTHPDVNRAVVIARPDRRGQARLVAYVLPSDESSDDTEPEEIAREQVHQWRSVWEDLVEPTTDDPTFDISGWVSSADGEPIPADQMHEWVDTTVARVRALAPSRVLEIGCGTGLLLWRLAPDCESYVGTDIAPSQLARLSTEIRRRGWSHVEVFECEALDIGTLAPRTFDLVILNSVVQYFPSGDYLRRTLEVATRLLTPDGHLFIGDVRSLPLHAMQHLWAELAKQGSIAARGDLPAIVRRQCQRDNELVVDPRLFARLSQQLRPGSHVQVMPKLGRSANEMVLFRYDVVVHADSGTRLSPVPSWHDWPGADGISRLLREDRPPSIGLRAVPNRRLDALAAAWSRLTDAGAADRSAISPDELLALAARYGYHAELSWASAHPDGAFDAVLTVTNGQPAMFPSPPPVHESGFTNRPLGARLRDDRTRRLVPALREHVALSLPAHMRPAVYVVLDELQLTSSGKVNRRALPDPDGSRPALEATFRAPRTATEETLAELWAQVLGLDRVGIGDNFFELGGDSIVTIQLVARCRSAGIVITPRQIFERQTIADLAAVAEVVEPAEAQAEDAGAPFALAGLTAQQIDAVTAMDSQVVDLYPLTPTQQGMLFHSLYEPGSAIYIEQLTLTIDGLLDRAVYR